MTALSVSRTSQRLRRCFERRHGSSSAVRAHAGLSVATFLADYVDALAPAPVHLPLDSQHRVPSNALLCMLRDEAGDKLVEVEHGRYDMKGSSQLHMPLHTYLDWLETASTAVIGEQQLYLAQQRLFELAPSLKELVKAPSFLSPLLGNQLDLYQTSCFLGSKGAVTPLHRDPYENVFMLPVTSSETASKLFTFVPAKSVTRTKGGLMSNTAAIEDEAVKELPGALTVEVKHGEAVYVPRGWFHRVENIDTVAGAASWSLGVGWWFRRRNTVQ